MAPRLGPELEKLHRSQARLQAVIQSAPVGILEVDLRGRVIRWNPGGGAYLRAGQPEEIIGQPVPDCPPVEAGGVPGRSGNGALRPALPECGDLSAAQGRLLVDVELAAAPVRDSSGRVVSHMVVFSDITRRKRQERELHASRARIVQAADTERRRLERNLHDGAQQRLVSLALLLRLAGAALDHDPPGARSALDQGLEELGLALGELRELARGLHPAILTSGGLGVALQSLAGRAPVPVTVTGVPSDRLPDAAEAAAYDVVAEALTNVAKYAAASAARVHL